MTPYKKDIEIRFGDRKEIFIRIRERVWDPGTGTYIPGDYRDLTGYTFLAQVRETKDATAVLMSFTVTLGNQADATYGKGAINLKMTGTTTSSIARTIAIGVWDLEVTDPQGNVDTYMEGAVTFTKDVSRV